MFGCVVGAQVTLCVRRATFVDPGSGIEDPARHGACSTFLCDAAPGTEVRTERGAAYMYFATPSRSQTFGGGQSFGHSRPCFYTFPFATARNQHTSRPLS